MKTIFRFFAAGIFVLSLSLGASIPSSAAAGDASNEPSRKPAKAVLLNDEEKAEDEVDQPAAQSDFTPRLLISAFSTDPAEVNAGQNFKLTLTLSNTSNHIAVGNVKVSVTSADSSLLPVSGASSVYIPIIYAGGQQSTTMDFRALPNLEEQPYQLSVHAEYEDVNTFQSYSSDETIAVVVHQPIRAELGQIQVLPETIEVGQQASISFALQNQGKATLYNAKVNVKENPQVEATETYIGNVAAGTSASADLLVRGIGAGESPVILQISYEDSTGAQKTLDREIQLSVTEPVEEAPEDTAAEQKSIGFVWVVPLLFLALIVGAIVLIIVMRNRRKKKNEEALRQQYEQDETILLPPPNAADRAGDDLPGN